MKLGKSVNACMFLVVLLSLFSLAVAADQGSLSGCTRFSSKYVKCSVAVTATDTRTVYMSTDVKDATSLNGKQYTYFSDNNVLKGTLQDPVNPSSKITATQGFTNGMEVEYYGAPFTRDANGVWTSKYVDAKLDDTKMKSYVWSANPTQGKLDKNDPNSVPNAVQGSKYEVEGDEWTYKDGSWVSGDTGEKKTKDQMLELYRKTVYPNYNPQSSGGTSAQQSGSTASQGSTAYQAAIKAGVPAAELTTGMSDSQIQSAVKDRAQATELAQKYGVQDYNTKSTTAIWT
ncbi:hypothetical protein KY363_02785, partial [Candidatus Woesearchaeota archaeon]|nr:hypothetical protein [Candidatus Woesearchaeota archaeon]